MKKGLWIGCAAVAGLGVLVCGGLIALGVMGFFGILAATKPMADAADQFLTLLGQGKTAEAYASTGSVFRAQHDEASFTAGVQQLGLTDYVSSSWTSRNFENQNGSVEGTVTTKKGSGPAKVELVYEQRAWHVAGLHYGDLDLADAMKLTVPPDEELRRLTTGTLLDFDQAVRAKDFTAFHGTLSDQWRKQTTPEELKRNFQQFVDKGVSIGKIKAVAPQFDPAPKIDAEGMLEVAGRYPTKPNKVMFELKYLHQDDGWKPFALHVTVAPAP